jgi:hypothetical protein
LAYQPLDNNIFILEQSALRPIRLAYQPLDNSIFILEQISHWQ